METSPLSAWTAEDERVVAGGLPDSTIRRLERLGRWHGSTSFLSPGGTVAADALGLEAVGQVVGASGGVVQEGVIRTVRPGQGRRRRGTAAWLEQTGPVKSWATARRRALGRLAAQARTLGADAVVGIRAERRAIELADPAEAYEVVMTGTAVRSPSRRARAAGPLLTLASPQEMLLLQRAGLEPAGVAGASAHVRIWLGKDVRGLRRGRTGELGEVTAGVYEARRLAIGRLTADAQALGAHGLIGVRLDHEHRRSAAVRGPELLVAVHVLADAVRRRHPGSTDPLPTVGLARAPRG